MKIVENQYILSESLCYKLGAWRLKDSGVTEGVMNDAIKMHYGKFRILCYICD